MNKTDSYIDFDPTQVEVSCGEVQFDNDTLTWKRQPAKTPQPGEDCSKVQQQLDQANGVIADQYRLLEQKTKQIVEAENKVAKITREKDAVEAKAKEVLDAYGALETQFADTSDKLTKAEQRIAELEAQLANQPTECDILKKHLDPIYRLNGDVVGYGIKNPPECLENVAAITGLNPDNVIGNVVTQP